MAKIAPKINDWYQDVREDEFFEVVAVDEQEGWIEVQYLNGEIGEFDFDTWEQMVLLSAQPPEDWRVAFEMADEDEDGSTFSMSNWDDPLANIDSDAQPNFDDY